MKDIIYNILTNNPQLLLWQGLSYGEGSLRHVVNAKLGLHYASTYQDICNPFSGWCSSEQEWKKENNLFYTNFKIPRNERIIFHRDNTFFSSAHNQGLVITDEKIYLIEDNDYPDARIWFHWGTIKEVRYQNKTMHFSFRDGDELDIGIKFFIKRHDYCKDRQTERIGRSLEKAFNYITAFFDDDDNC